MKKYYYLDFRKKWQGPYVYHQILLFTLIDKIKPHSYLWHDKLALDIGSHPTKSIYSRRKASDFRSLPGWVFGYNLKILASNFVQKILREIGRKNDWEKFITKPHDIPATDKGAINLFIIPSLTSVNDFASPGDFSVKLIYIEISGEEKKVKSAEYPIRLSFDSLSGIKYEVTLDNPPFVGGVHHQESYGLHRGLYLKGDNENIAVGRNCAFEFTTRFPFKPQILKGRFKQANQIGLSQYKQCYNRMLIKTGDTEFIGMADPINHTGTHWFDHDNFNVFQSLIGLSFRHSSVHTDIIINDIGFRIYSLPKDIAIIDGLDLQDLDEFKNYVEVIRIASALLTGKFYGGTTTYVAAADSEFNDIDGVWYEVHKASVISSRRMINLSLFRMSFDSNDKDYKDKYQKIDRGFDSNLFAELCRMLYESESLMHAAALVINAMGNIDPLQQGASYAVALETLTTELGAKKSKDLKPINDKVVARALADEMRAVITKYDAHLSEEAQVILGKKIDSINSPTNRDKLVKTFTLYGMSLSTEDISTIDKRNAYLHGRSPLSRKQEFELTQISLRLHTLIVSLMLKVAGYSGHVVNLDKAIYLLYEEKLNEKIMETEMQTLNLIEKAKTSIKDEDKEGFESINLQLLELMDNSLTNQLIRII